jgi:hypothetical protein
MHASVEQPGMEILKSPNSEENESKIQRRI